MAVTDKIISFWKRVRVKSSDMFTLFKVGVGIKVPTHKLHVKDKTDPMKLEGVQSDTSSSTKFLVLDGSDVIKHSAGTAKTTEEVQDIVGAMFTSNTETGIAATYEDSDGTIDLVVDHDAASNFVAEEHYRWDTDISGTATIHTNNITDLHGAGVDGAANQLLTDDGDGTVTSEANLTFDGSTLNVGGTDNNNIIISRTANDDNVGGRLYIEAGDAAGTNKAGGDLNIIAGRGTGNAAGGSIFLQSSAAGSSGSSINSAANIVEIDNVGNLQIDGGLTVGSTSFVNSSGVVQVATQGTIDHDSLANFVANEHIDWTGSSAGTIHSSNIPTLNQDTTGNAAGIAGATDGDVTITSDGEVTVKLDADNDEGDQKFKITNNADTEVASISETGELYVTGDISNSGSDNDLAFNSDGNMTFVIDRDNDETGQYFSFKNFNVEIANLDESGNLQIDGDLTVSGGNITNAVTFDSGITDSGTIAGGTWNGTAIASAYLDADTAHLTTTQTFTGAKTFDAKLTLDGDKQITPSGDGITLHVDAQDITDSSTSASGTASFFNHVVIENPRVMATNASVTTTEANTVYIKGAPVASTNQTITTANSLKVAAGNVDFGADLAVGANLNVTGIITGKQREIYSQSFLDDLGTTKHYLPFKDINEQTTIYQEEAAMLMPCDGRIVSVTVKTASVTGSGNMTIGVNTIAPNVNIFSTSNWTEEETESLAVSSADDYHVFHFAFDNAKHFDSGDLVTISIQNDADLSGTTYWYVTTVVEYDWNTYLGTTSAEYDSNP